jgi:carbamoyltransferase
MNMALAIQGITEDVVLRLANTAQDLTDSDFLVMAGGVALNCVANGKVLRRGLFKDLWIQPAAGDAGGALGAALAGWHIWKGYERKLNSGYDSMKGAYLGPDFGESEIRKTAKSYGASFVHFENYSDLCKEVVDRLVKGRVVGWFQGRMEFGPRALGNRSILGDPRRSDMQKKLNLKIKYREGFRPFAPSVLAEESHHYFDIEFPSPYMLLVAPVRAERRNSLPPGYHSLPLYQRLYHLRSDIPAITHIDYSARIQTVHKETNQRYWHLIQAFKEQTGYGLIVNTSFNVRGEPIVCSPDDAYRCFMRTEMDDLVMEDFLFEKEKQPVWREEGNWREKYGFD